MSDFQSVIDAAQQAVKLNAPGIARGTGVFRDGEGNADTFSYPLEPLSASCKVSSLRALCDWGVSQQNDPLNPRHTPPKTINFGTWITLGSKHRHFVCAWYDDFERNNGHAVFPLQKTEAWKTILSAYELEAMRAPRFSKRQCLTLLKSTFRDMVDPSFVAFVESINWAAKAKSGEKGDNVSRGNRRDHAYTEHEIETDEWNGNGESAPETFTVRLPALYTDMYDLSPDPISCVLMIDTEAKTLDFHPVNSDIEKTVIETRGRVAAKLSQYVKQSVDGGRTEAGYSHYRVNAAVPSEIMKEYGL